MPDTVHGELFCSFFPSFVSILTAEQKNDTLPVPLFTEKTGLYRLQCFGAAIFSLLLVQRVRKGINMEFSNIFHGLFMLAPVYGIRTALISYVRAHRSNQDI
jgi:hypothetical protein